MNTKTARRNSKVLTNLIRLVIMVTKKMETSRIYAAILTTIIITGAFTISPAISLMVSSLTIRSSGKIGTPSTRPLHVEGRWIKDSSGNIVILSGVNGPNYVDRALGVWAVPGTTRRQYSWNEGGAVEANLDAQASWGSNVQRVLFALSYWKFDKENFRQHIKEHLTWAAERGMYVIFCAYQVLGWDEGGRRDQMPYPPYLVNENPDLAAQTVNSVQDFIDIWSTIANELKSYPNVIFEFWNEPHVESERRNWIDNIVPALVSAVRDTGAQNLILLQWTWDIWHNNQGGHNDISWIDEYLAALQNQGVPTFNIFFSTHVYVQNMFGRDIPANVTKEELAQRYSNCLLDYYSQRVPVVIGETGVGGTDDVSVDAFYKSMLVWNDWNIGYIGWIWRHSGIHALLQSTSYIPPPTAKGQALIDAIARARPLLNSES